jgi:hypothetical protein
MLGLIYTKSDPVTWSKSRATILSSLTIKDVRFVEIRNTFIFYKKLLSTIIIQKDVSEKSSSERELL